MIIPQSYPLYVQTKGVEPKLVLALHMTDEGGYGPARVVAFITQSGRVDADVAILTQQQIVWGWAPDARKAEPIDALVHELLGERA